MHGLAYPFVFKCSGCGAETQVTREDASDMHPDPDSQGALGIALQQRGWLKAPREQALYCSDCVDDKLDE